MNNFIFENLVKSLGVEFRSGDEHNYTRIYRLDDGSVATEGQITGKYQQDQRRGIVADEADPGTYILNGNKPSGINIFEKRGGYDSLDDAQIGITNPFAPQPSLETLEDIGLVKPGDTVISKVPSTE